MRPNTGSLPAACIIRDEDGNVTGFRAVNVRLFNGLVRGPWPSKGGRPLDTVWRISKPPHPFQIECFEVI